MSTPNVQLVMLPIPDWKVARYKLDLDSNIIYVIVEEQ